MSDTNEHTHSLPKGTRIKDYEIESVLGKGGFGITYLATDVNLKKKVAIKELLPDGIATRGSGMSVVAQTTSQQSDFRWAVDSFLKEAQILAGFDHPNIVHVYRLFEEHQTAYMVMPFIEGVSLKQVVKNKGTLPFEDVEKILTLLMDGLEVVHHANTLHRDIKPDNVIITGKGVPMLIDFGAARQQISGKTQDVTSIITPGYAPVEQYSTDARYQGPWSDIYALAACCYFMITGKQPTPASERNDAVRNRQPDPLSKLVDLAPKGFPPVFLASLDTALQMSESMRPQSIQDWRKQLAGVASSPPPMPEGANSTPSPTDNSDQTRLVSDSRTPRRVPSEKTSPPSEINHLPKKKKKTGLIATVCALIIVALGTGSYFAWKSFSDDPDIDGSIASKLDKIETYLEVNKPHKAKTMLSSIKLESVPVDDKDRYKKLSKSITELIDNGKSTLSVSFEPSWAQTYIDGKKCGVTNGKIEVTGLGSHTLRISADGHQSRSISFEAKEIGGTVTLNKVKLNESNDAKSIGTLLDAIETAINEGNYAEVVRLKKEIESTKVPGNWKKQADHGLREASKFIAKNKWLVSLVVRPSTASLHLNGKRIYLKNGKFQTTRSGKHTLKLSADGYEDKTHEFGLNTSGKPIDLGTITLTENTKKSGEKTIGITKQEAINVSKNYLTLGNSKFPNHAQIDGLADTVFWQQNQDKATPKEDIRKEIVALHTRWKVRTITPDVDSANVKLHSTGKSWVVSLNYDFTWEDGIFINKGKREGLFIVMKSGGKTKIVAHMTKVIGNDKRTFDSKALIAALKEFNQTRLSAGDSEGGKSVFVEASYYSNNTEYYGPRFLTRTQIVQKIRESRGKDSTRIYTAKTYSDFTNVLKEDDTSRTFSFKCVTAVHKSSGRSSRTETVKVKFVNGKPSVISVRY